MKKTYLFCGLMLALCAFLSCSECNDCLDLQQKNLLVRDENGANLLFGDAAQYEPRALSIRSEGNTTLPVFVDETSQTIYFFLEENQTDYTIDFDENFQLNLVFELGARKSEVCCGDQVISLATQVNGMSVDNSDTITITKEAIQSR